MVSDIIYQFNQLSAQEFIEINLSSTRYHYGYPSKAHLESYDRLYFPYRIRLEWEKYPDLRVIDYAFMASEKEKAGQIFQDLAGLLSSRKRGGKGV